MRRFYRSDNLTITLLVFVVIAGLYFAPAKIQFLQPMAAALGDFDLTDLVFSQLRDTQAIPGDTSIVLVNIGDLPRSGIAREVAALARAHPRVIAIDAFFRAPKGAEQDTPLAQALAGAGRVVLVNELSGIAANATRFDSLRGSLPDFTAHATQGFANLVIDNDNGFRTARVFSPKEHVGDSVIWSFDSQILRAYDSSAFTRLARRGNGTEIINYRGNLNKFYTLDARDVLDTAQDLSFVQGKIVLMGFMGPRIGTPSLEDVFFTPLNSRYVGKTFPDMYGVVVHANIISMALHDEYIEKMPLWIGIVLAIVLCHLHAVFYSLLRDRYEKWFDAVTTAIQLGETVAVLWLTVVVFETFQTRIDLTLALVAMVLCGSVFEVYHSLIHQTLTHWKIKLSARRRPLQ